MPRALSNKTLAGAVASAAVALAVLSVTGRVDAQADDARPLRLTVRARGCTTEQAFFQLLARKTARVRRSAPGEPGAAVDIEITRDGAQTIGKLRWSTSGESPSAPARTVRGDSCDEIVATLSLMVAIALDPGVSGSAPAEAAPPVVAPKGLEPPSPPRAAQAPPSAEATAGRFVLSLGGHVEVSNAGGATPAPAFGFYFEIERRLRPRPVAAWLPSVRVAASYREVAIDRAGVTGAAAWKVARIDACPWRLALADTLTLRPCAFVEAGALDLALATGVVNARAVTRPWVAPGARFRLTWDIVDPLSVGFDAAVAVPAYRDAFRVEPDLQLFRAPPAVASATLSLGIHFL